MKTCECDRHWWEAELEGENEKTLHSLQKISYWNVTAWDWKCEHGRLDLCDEGCNEEVKEPIPCPQGHIDTYIYDSPEHGLVLMCNPCEDGYSISFEEVKDD